MKYILLVFFYSCTNNVKLKSIPDQNKNYVTVVIKFKQTGKVIFHCIDTTGVKNYFAINNPAKLDTTIIKQIETKNPIHLHYGVFFDGGSKFQNYLLLPADTLKLIYGNNGLLSLSDSPSFYEIDSLFNINTSGWPFQEYFNDKSNKPIAVTFNEIRKYENMNNNKIASLYAESIINIRRKDAFQGMNKILCNLYRANALQNPFNHTIKSDSLNQFKIYLRKNLNDQFTINSMLPFSYMNLISDDNAIVKTKQTGLDIIKKQIKIVDSLNNNYWYKGLIAYTLKDEMYFKNKESITSAIKLLNDAGISDERFNNILYRENEKAKKLKTASVAMQDINGDVIDFNAMISANKGKYLLIDFWATWCTPCRQQLPYLIKAKSEFKKKDIEFISISIDTDAENEEWITTAQNEKIADVNKSYRLLNGPRNSLLKILNFQSVPRYILIDKKGVIVNNNFIVPTEANFIKELDKCISL